MSHKNHNTCKMHDKGRNTLKETSKERFTTEKKDMEHEFTHNKTAIGKLLNENFQYESTSKRRGGYVVKFQHPTSHKMEKINFEFETNLKNMETDWLT